jgi:hypothetical protein
MYKTSRMRQAKTHKWVVKARRRRRRRRRRRIQCTSL